MFCLGDGKYLVVSFFMSFVVTKKKLLTVALSGCLDLHFHVYVVRFFDLPEDGLESIFSICGGELIS